MNDLEKSLYEKPIDTAYRIVTLTPNKVSYLKFTDFLLTDVGVWLCLFRKLSLQQVDTPYAATLGRGFDLQAIDALCPSANWEDRLRIHHALGKLYLEHDAPSYVYASFHIGLLLDEYNYEEFARAWVLETLGIGNRKLKESLKSSPDHIVLVRSPGSFGYIFRKTPFVLAQLALKAKEIDGRAEAAKLDAMKQAVNEARSSASSYVITLAPGAVRYLEEASFLEADVQHWINLIGGLSEQPKIRPPSHLDVIDKLLPGLSWESRLRAHHALGRFHREQGVPLSVYYCFHSHLKLTALALDACLNAWVREASGNTDLMESFVGAQDYLVFRNVSPYGENCVFRKTPFVNDRLAEIERVVQLDARKQLEEDGAQKESEELDRLRNSKFDTFLYVMEDLRNGYFKIGRSRSPGKRERTLQSEVPQIVLRFSIPADEEHERQLHDHFANKRLRGEWFALAPGDLQWLVSFLKRNGDAARACIDYQWLGEVAFKVRDDTSAT